MIMYCKLERKRFVTYFYTWAHKPVRITKNTGKVSISFPAEIRTKYLTNASQLCHSLPNCFVSFIKVAHYIQNIFVADSHTDWNYITLYYITEWQENGSDMWISVTKAFSPWNSFDLKKYWVNTKLNP